jgi:hypothetical protein
MEESSESDWLGHVEGMQHETCLQVYQKSLIVLNSQLPLYVPICIPSYRHNDIFNTLTDDYIHMDIIRIAEERKESGWLGHVEGM